ncbi:hypothetical protein GSY74_04800 [Sulfurovum sp. bin170]|uniref:hypothetical protein n=1 Tax=Sulfurovum sp. bin170 TaxID=2695268 RepID=UPI0013DFBF16|nr:hypothetical protein [Sulfurovum sp. bin170]NEW60595.1 hypothetical protein [Sulfurovum sp. bin170]
MKYKIITLTFLLLSSTALAFQDYDIDGVEDSADLCPDTPFDVLVNKDGCPQSGEKTQTNDYYGRLTLKIGTDISRDETYEDDSSFNLYANYRYRNWDVAISNSRTTSNSSYTEDNSYSDDDIYLSTGYIFSLPSSKMKLSIGSKIVNDGSDTTTSTRQQGRFSQHITTEEETVASRDNDYFASVNFNYLLSPKQDIFLYYGHTLSGDSKDMDYEDYSSFSIGTGYALTNSWYSALSYNHTSSIYPDADAEQGLSWFNSYKFTKNIFAMASYKYALEDFSYDHTLSLGLGVYFQ